MAGGAVLGWVNWADTATLSTTTSGSMLRPLSELQVKWARGLCRGPANGTGVDPATLVIRADLGSSKVFHAVGLIGLNGVTYTNMTVVMSTSAFGGTDAGTGGHSWDPAYGEEFGQGLFITAPNGYWTARYIQISVEVAGRGAGTRYVDARRLLIMAGGMWADGFDSSWDTSPTDLSVTEDTPRGGTFVSEQGKHREMTISLSGMTLTEALNASRTYNNYDSLRAVLAGAGTSKEVVVVPRYTTDEEFRYHTAAYGRLTGWGPIRHTGGDTFACDSIKIKETPHPPLS